MVWSICPQGYLNLDILPVCYNFNFQVVTNNLKITVSDGRREENIFLCSVWWTKVVGSVADWLTVSSPAYCFLWLVFNLFFKIWTHLESRGAELNLPQALPFPALHLVRLTQHLPGPCRPFLCCLWNKACCPSQAGAALWILQQDFFMLIPAQNMFIVYLCMYKNIQLQ